MGSCDVKYICINYIHLFLNLNIIKSYKYPVDKFTKTPGGMKLILLSLKESLYVVEIVKELKSPAFGSQYNLFSDNNLQMKITSKSLTRKENNTENKNTGKRLS